MGGEWRLTGERIEGQVMRNGLLRILPVCMLMVCGCGGSEPSPESDAAAPASKREDPQPEAFPQPQVSEAAPAADPRDATTAEPSQSGEPKLSNTDDPQDDALAQLPRQREIDEARVKQAGIHKYTGRHITIYSDAKPEAVRDLPQVFDLAVPQWRAYFGITDKRKPPWKVTAHVLANRVSRERFQKLGLWRDGIPDFNNGFAFPDAFWMYDQPASDYYRRHLMLHEGVHSFMFSHLGGCGAAWYMEGMAELLGTHHLEGGRLTVNYFPQNRAEVPMLGRIKIVQDAYDAGKALSLEKVVALNVPATATNDRYGWCWGAAAFLDGHPRYQQRFRQLRQHVTERDFNEQFAKRFADDWRQLAIEWQVFVAHLEHGYDLKRMAIDFAAGKPLGGEKQVTVRADAGWQNTGIRLQAGHAYDVTASGRYQVEDTFEGQPKIWWSEPGGISFRYYHGQPLGILLAAVVPDDAEPADARELWEPRVIGLNRRIEPDRSGTLYLRINDSAGELNDNKGTLRVVVAGGG